jgi:tetratricopeptide (TPR) repeat protein
MKTWIWILLAFTIAACGQKKILSKADAAGQFCACFNSQTTGGIDDRLSPCLQQVLDLKQSEFMDEGITNQDSIQQKVSSFSLDVMLEMIHSCDNYFSEVSDLYDKGYSVDTTTLNMAAIKDLTMRIQSETNRDTIKSLLHKKVFKLIQARQFDMALKNIDSIKSLDNTDYGANLANAYIFHQTGLYDKAIDEIDQAIEISGNENLKLYAEISRRRRDSK